MIKIIEDNKMLDACQNTGNYFKKELEVLKGRHRDKIKEVRGRGLMLALELADVIDGSQIDKKLFDNGLVVGFKANTFRFLPPSSANLALSSYFNFLGVSGCIILL